MNELDSLYIEPNHCAECCRCVRECPLKAVALTADGARINMDLCVECGACLSICKQEAIKVRNDVHLARRFIKSYSIKVASVSPQWALEFGGIDVSRFVEVLKLLGFTHVSESALGAQQTMVKEMELASRMEGVSISARCPAVVDYIMKFKPKVADRILPVASPMVAHARMIKSWWGQEARIVHLSACVASKREAAQHPELIDLALTFSELRQWMNDEGIDFDHIAGHDSYQFEPVMAKGGLLYPLCGATEAEGGELTTIHESSLPGIERLLDKMPPMSGRSVYLDLMACPDGCLGSNAIQRRQQSLIEERLVLEDMAAGRTRIDDSYALPYIELNRQEESPHPVNRFVPEGQTLAALDGLGLPTQLQQVDCNACGYGTCRRFAKALSRGEVPKEMCIHYVRSELKSKFSALLGHLAVGVAVVGSNQRIVEANRILATMLGMDAEAFYDAHPGLKGVEMAEILPFSPMVASVLENGDESLVRDVQIKERIITVSVHTIQRYRSVLVICRNMLFSQVRNEEIVARTQKVVKENLETVRKIAYMLGENASRTEAILNSILHTQSIEHGG